MDINTGAQQDLRYHAAIFNERGCLLAWGGDALRPVQNLRRYIPSPPSLHPLPPGTPPNEFCPGVPAGPCVVLRRV